MLHERRPKRHGRCLRDRKSWSGRLSCQCLPTRYDCPKYVSSSSCPPFLQKTTQPSNLPSDMMPPILAGILSIYGLVIGVVISSALKEKSALHTNFMYLSAGLACGLCCLSAGFCIGIVGDAGVRGTAQQPRLFMGMMLMLIFGEALGKFPWP